MNISATLLVIERSKVEARGSSTNLTHVMIILSATAIKSLRPLIFTISTVEFKCDKRGRRMSSKATAGPFLQGANMLMAVPYKSCVVVQCTRGRETGAAEWHWAPDSVGQVCPRRSPPSHTPVEQSWRMLTMFNFHCHTGENAKCQRCRESGCRGRWCSPWPRTEPG